MCGVNTWPSLQNMRRPFAAAPSAAEERLPTELKRRRAAGDWEFSLWLLRVFMAAAACYSIGLHELVASAFTTVSCQPPTVGAGQDVTCSISLSTLASPTELSVTQSGHAGRLSMLEQSERSYRISFETASSGAAGVVVSHSLFWSSSSVQVRVRA